MYQKETCTPSSSWTYAIASQAYKFSYALRNILYIGYSHYVKYILWKKLRFESYIVLTIYKLRQHKYSTESQQNRLFSRPPHPVFCWRNKGMVSNGKIIKMKDILLIFQSIFRLAVLGPSAAASNVAVQQPPKSPVVTVSATSGKVTVSSAAMAAAVVAAHGSNWRPVISSSQNPVNISSLTLKFRNW